MPLPTKTKGTGVAHARPPRFRDLLRDAVQRGYNTDAALDYALQGARYAGASDRRSPATFADALRRTSKYGSTSDAIRDALAHSGLSHTGCDCGCGGNGGCK